jgi:hypothetical protein
MDEGLIAYGTSDPLGPYDPSAEIVGQDGGALSQVGTFFGNLLSTVSRQLPGIIMDEIDPATGQPMPVYRTQAAAPSPLGGMLPLLLIGGVALYLLTSKRR